MLRPNKIIFGGGVINEKFLEKVRSDFNHMLNGYIDVPDLNKYLSMLAIANNGSATIGNFALAKKILK